MLISSLEGNAARAVVLEDVLYRRANRALEARGVALRRARGRRALRDLGRYYVENLTGGEPTAAVLDLEGFARELGVLAPHEALFRLPAPWTTKDRR